MSSCIEQKRMKPTELKDFYYNYLIKQIPNLDEQNRFYSQFMVLETIEETTEQSLNQSMEQKIENLEDDPNCICEDESPNIKMQNVDIFTKFNEMKKFVVNDLKSQIEYSDDTKKIYFKNFVEPKFFASLNKK